MVAGKTNFKGAASEEVFRSEIAEIFPEYTEVVNFARMQILGSQLNENFSLPSLEMLPHFRFTPNRVLLQRMVRRCTTLGQYFTTFDEEDEEWFTKKAYPQIKKSTSTLKNFLNFNSENARFNFGLQKARFRLLGPLLPNFRD